MACLLHQETDCTSFAIKLLQIICIQPFKRSLHFWKFVCIFEMAWSRAFQKCIICHFWTNFFCKHFYYKTWFCDKKFNFPKFANFFADSKRRAQELSNDVSFVIFGHKTWDFLVFKYPSRDRVKNTRFLPRKTQVTLEEQYSDDFFLM